MYAWWNMLLYVMKNTCTKWKCLCVPSLSECKKYCTILHYTYLLKFCITKTPITPSRLPAVVGNANQTAQYASPLG